MFVFSSNKAKPTSNFTSTSLNQTHCYTSKRHHFYCLLLGVSLLTHCWTGFLGFLTVELEWLSLLAFCLLGPKFLCLLELGPFDVPPTCFADTTAGGSFCVCSSDSLVDVELGIATGCGRYIPGNMTISFLGSIKPLFSFCKFRMASNLCLLMISFSDWRSVSSSLSSSLSEVWNPRGNKD